jgi:hypothetical protein
LSEASPRGSREYGVRSVWPWLAVIAVVMAAALELRRQGRLWICACGRVLPWVGNAWSRDTSQHLFDPYTFTHMLHGLLFCGLLAWMLPRLPWRWRLWLAVAAEALWEVIENSDFVIRRYRETTAALGYTGDTIVNSLGDITACFLGFLLARRLGPLRSALLFVATEVVLLVWIRDSFLLNILLLIYPSGKLRAWQAGH